MAYANKEVQLQEQVERLQDIILGLNNKLKAAKETLHDRFMIAALAGSAMSANDREAEQIARKARRIADACMRARDE